MTFDVVDRLPEWLSIALAVAFLVVVVSFGLIMIFKPSTIQSIEVHDMGAGVTCYTFNASIDCLQVEIREEN